MKLGDRLANCRKEKGLTQEYVAQEMEVTRQTVSNWETGHVAPSLDKLHALALLYQTSLYDLIEGDTQTVKSRSVVSQWIGKRVDVEYLSGVVLSGTVTDMDQQWLVLQLDKGNESKVINLEGIGAVVAKEGR